MSRAFGFIAVLVALGIGLYIASRQIGSVNTLTNNNPKATVEITGVQNDLLAIANAERRHQASTGNYAPLDELISSGDLNMPSTSRGPYNYSVELTDGGFVASAVADNPPPGAPRTLRVNAQMTISRE